MSDSTAKSVSPINDYMKTTPVGQRYWNANMPNDEWTDECPDFLVGQGEKNIQILSGQDRDYHWLSWAECRQLVALNRIDQFQRPPSDLRRYLRYMAELRREYGSVLNFVQQERLRWSSVEPSSDPPFNDTNDYKILYNDWPYGIDRDITHLVVWTKFLLEDDPTTGFLTPNSHKMIDNFVTRTFCSEAGMQRDDVIWFKNWKSLKSVHALEHFHVMLYRAPAKFLKFITNDDIPMCEIVTEKEEK